MVGFWLLYCRAGLLCFAEENSFDLLNLIILYIFVLIDEDVVSSTSSCVVRTFDTRGGDPIWDQDCEIGIMRVGSGWRCLLVCSSNLRNRGSDPIWDRDRGVQIMGVGVIACRSP